MAVDDDRLSAHTAVDEDGVLPGPNVVPVSDEQQRKLESNSASIAAPLPVASANEGKNYTEAYNPSAPASASAPASSPLLCGPILRYTHQSDGFSKWHGSALVVLSRKGSLRMTLDDGKSVEAMELYAEEGRFFYRFDMEVEQRSEGRNVPYSIEVEGAERIERSFHVAAKGEAFHILFHSCNGFCDGADEATAGLSLWSDVLRSESFSLSSRISLVLTGVLLEHEKKPFDVMVGGGDQIYSDGVQGKGAPLEEWGALKTGHLRAAIKFTKGLKTKVDQWYFTNHCDWFNTAPFRQAASQIPSVNIWDDHDIIDGFGSYKDRWQKAPVFMGVGEIAWKYMCLFQQHVNPNVISEPDPSAPSERYADEPDHAKEPFYIVHPEAGPYIRHKGISIMSSFGPEVAFVGFDCRTDRTQRTICYDSTYDAIFKRMEQEVVTGQTKHLLVLLGVPIAYPRLVWLENAMQSPHLVRPLRWINKLCGVFGSVFNDFDGQVELLDDLQDHWACGLHKKERNALIKRLQDFALRKQVRVTILSGDVHLAAVGRFYSKKSLNVPHEQDHRYIVNVISSAITNAPPPAAVAQVLNQRNKLHHMDRSTDENLMHIWNVSTDNSNRINSTTYPARNFCTINLLTEQDRLSQRDCSDDASGATKEKVDVEPIRAKKVRGTAEEEDLDTRKEKKGVSNGHSGPGSLKVQIHIEVDQKSEEGKTKAYGFHIPTLMKGGAK